MTFSTSTSPYWLRRTGRVNTLSSHKILRKIQLILLESQTTSHNFSFAEISTGLPITTVQSKAIQYRTEHTNKD